MASFPAVPGTWVPGEATPGDPGAAQQSQAPAPPPGAAQRPVVIAYRN